MNPPADWYPDPTGHHEQRYWDGGQWTEHVFTDGVQGTDPLETTAPASATADETAPADEPEIDETATADGTGEDAAEETPAFAAAYSEQAGETTPRSEDETDLWTPAGESVAAAERDEDEDEDHAASAADEPVHADVAPEDVVANLDEVSGSADDEPRSPALEDAFVLSPETASRIVSRGQPAQATSAAGDGTDPAPGSGADATDAPAAEAEATDDAVPALADAPPPQSAAIDAPPPRVPPTTAASTSGLGITGDLVSGAFSEREGDGPVALQNVRLLRCHVGPGDGVVARQGTMVAYQGEVQFERQGAGGVGRALKRAATGEGLAMMRVEGRGDVFFADEAQHVFLLHLDGSGPGISVNGRNVLAFSAALDWDIERVKGASLLAGGLFNTTLTGTGWVALVADGEPVVLRTDEAPTYVDVNALVAWSGGLSTRVVNQVSAKSLVGLGSGEAFQMTFDGAGVVIVQPSEGPMQGAAAT